MTRIAEPCALALLALLAGALPAAGAQSADASTLVSAAADTYLDAATPRSSHGDAKLLVVDGRPARRALLRFELPSGRVTGLTLRLHAVAAARARLVVRSAACSWSASRVTWRTRPKLGVVLATRSRVRARWSSIDVRPPRRSGVRTVCVQLTTSGGRRVRFHGLGSAGPAQLVVDTAAGTPAERTEAPAADSRSQSPAQGSSSRRGSTTPSRGSGDGGGGGTASEPALPTPTPPVLIPGSPGPPIPPPPAPATGGPQLFLSPDGSDSNPCTSEAPCRTLAEADELATPGTTVNVAPGLYPAARLRASGTSDARIRWVSTERWAAQVTPGIKVAGEWVDVEAFQLSGPSQSNTGISLWGSHSRAIGNYVHDLPIPDSSDGGSGIVAGGGPGGYSSHHQEILANRIADVGAPPVNSRVHGLYWSASDVLIANNVVVRSQGYGIHAWHAATRSVVVNNTSVANGRAGIIVGHGDSGATPEGHRETWVVNNIVAFNRDGAIRESNADDNHYVNNLAWGNGSDRFGVRSSDVQGTIVADPLFVNASGDDLRVLPGSPAIDSGVAERAPATDFQGGGRPLGAAIDRGAYELG